MGLFTRGRDTDTDTIVAPVEERLDEGDHERFSHYVKKEKIVESAVSGKTVTALCGKNGYQTVTQNDFQSAQHVKRFTLVFEKNQIRQSLNEISSKAINRRISNYSVIPINYFATTN